MLKTEDLKRVLLKSEDSKYCFMCWEPYLSILDLNVKDLSSTILDLYDQLIAPLKIELYETALR